MGYKYPVTGGTALLAVLASLLWWQGKDMSHLTCDFEVSQGQIYRLITSTFLHIDPLHLIFNVYWLWTFGTFIEGVLGSFWTLAIYFVLALVSSAADYALAMGGVGLSGVGYGLFGMLWILNRWDSRFHDSIDQRTIVLFVVWFFICLLATRFKLMNIGNVAHGAGAVAGVLLGECIVRSGIWKYVFCSLTGGLLMASLAGALIFRPTINLQADFAAELERVAYRAMEQNQNEDAVNYYREALEYDSGRSRLWYNLGVAYGRLKRFEDASAAFDQAAKLNPHSKDYAKTRDDWKAYLDQLKGNR